jgi:hypothetical protein
MISGNPRLWRGLVIVVSVSYMVVGIQHLGAIRMAKAKSSWFDEESNVPMISEHARRLDSFLSAVADGKVEQSELDVQEQRLVALMRKIEPKLSPELHEQVTELLCELTAYDMMQVMHAIREAQPKRKLVL